MAIEIKEHELLAPHTIYKIGGAARFFAEAKNRGELEEALRCAAEKRALFFIMGAGSNTLVSDQGFDGMVIRMIGGEIKIDGERMIVDAGVMMARAASEAARQGLAGFAWAIGVPGTMGGSVRGNAGCFGHEMRDVVESVQVLKITNYKSQITNKSEIQKSNFQITELNSGECEFGYRDSVFKRHPEWVILSATLKLDKGDPATIQQEIRAMSAERAAKQDIGAKSCGCIFKNPSWPDAPGEKANLLARFPELAPFAGRSEIPAAFLIDRAGLKGKRVGRIVVSDKHANFFINEGAGIAEEVQSLIAAAKNTVQEKYGITLHEEIHYLGF